MKTKMVFTPRQLKDIETIKFFIPQAIPQQEKISEKDTEDFLTFSEKGIVPQKETEGYQALLQGKRWRGIHIDMYEQGIMDGSVPYFVLLEDMPCSVKDFLKREMFKGIDAEVIERAWGLLTNSKNNDP